MTKKRKTKQLRWLVTMMMLAMTMVMPISTWAQVMYTVFNTETKTLTFMYGNKPEGTDTEKVYDVPTDPTDPKTSPGWLATYNNSITTVVFDESFKNARPTSCYKWFYSCSKLTSIKNIENLNTEEVTNMMNMFRACKKLKSLDLSNFNTANVTNMGVMFYDCQSLESLILSSFNTANVTTMSNMFDGCKKLTSLKLSNFNTANVTDMGSMFGDCSSLTSIILSSFNTANVTDMSFMFYGCSSLTSLKLSNFNTANVTDMGSMFSSCSGLSSLALSNFDTSNVKNMTRMFNGCSGLKSLDLSSFKTANVTYMSYMFNGCSRLTSLDLSNFNTSNVTIMSYMFYNCSRLKSLNLSSFDTSNVTDMIYMFKDCKKLKSLDLSSFNTANVTNMSYMFNGCSGLTTIYVSDDFTTSDGTSGSFMFKDCTNLVGAAPYNSGKTKQSMANYRSGYFKTYFTLGENKVELCGEQLTTDILDLSGEKDFVAHAPFTANTATYSRDLSSSKSTWFSLCLPFAYTPDNFTAYQLKGASADAVEIEEMTGEIAAGTPVLFKFKDVVNNEEKKINISANKADIVKAPVDGTAVNGPDGSLQLCGTYQTKTFSSEDNNAFILLKDKLMNPARMLTTPGVTGVSVKPFRGYMTLTAPAQTSSARAFSIGHGGEEGTTAIDLLNSVATDDAEYYDINGRRIDAPVKGVNIVRRGNKTIKLIIK
ncbi:hypothetical protein CIK99_02260 [Prevotella sp. P5-92]|uniref:BspA family leucine-rich repeat surface protein n=1 Tax=Prevotella sp. P5-92 TaxID=2024222 RepID=UPI000B97476D|nr:BspA family leucine-rich repeat surface protein [Prevotella sp. P5-92]OYP59422.1 hypothetical protein CIK99_02260 [Prevotella sp. P5-92]